MTTASVRDLRYDFPKVFELLKQGGEVGITMRGRLIGTLIPVEPKATEKVRWPDIKKRLFEAHGKKAINPVASIISQRESER